MGAPQLDILFWTPLPHARVARMHHVTQYLELNLGVMAICACGWKSDPAPDRKQAADLFEVHRRESQ